MNNITVEDVVKNKILPVITLDDLSSALPLADALEATGMDVLEITLRTDIAIQAIEMLADRRNLIIGAGSVTTVQQMVRVHSLGAKFAVSPGIQQHLVEAARELGLIYIPGVSTPSEIMLGMSAGLDTLKFFPSETLGGVSALKAISAPFPGMSFIPTGGINTSATKEETARALARTIDKTGRPLRPLIASPARTKYVLDTPVARATRFLISFKSLFVSRRSTL